MLRLARVLGMQHALAAVNIYLYIEFQIYVWFLRKSLAVRFAV